MTLRNDLPRHRFGATNWSEGPPHPVDEPALYAGVLWRRVLAYIADVLLIAVLSGATWLVVGALGVLTFGLIVPVGIIALALIPLAYHTYFLGSRGATPGMRLFDIEMWDLTGGPVQYMQAAVATVVFYASVSLTAWLILIFALFNDRRRTVHDALAGTLVLRRSGPDRK